MRRRSCCSLIKFCGLFPPGFPPKTGLTGEQFNVWTFRISFDPIKEFIWLAGMFTNGGQDHFTNILRSSAASAAASKQDKLRILPRSEPEPRVEIATNKRKDGELLLVMRSSQLYPSECHC